MLIPISFQMKLSHRLEFFTSPYINDRGLLNITHFKFTICKIHTAKIYLTHRANNHSGKGRYTRIYCINITYYTSLICYISQKCALSISDNRSSQNSFHSVLSFSFSGNSTARILIGISGNFLLRISIALSVFFITSSNFNPLILS